MRLALVILALVSVLVPRLVWADIKPFVQTMKEPPKGFVVSHFEKEPLNFFGGEMGHIYTLEGEPKNLQWRSIRLKGAGLITAITSSPQHNTSGAAQSIYAVSTQGRIYRSTLKALEDRWQEVFVAPKKEQGPLFDIAMLDDKRLLAVGAFGLVLESIDQGDTWQSVGHQLENPDAAHLYKVFKMSQTQHHKYGIEAFIVGEFGQVFARFLSIENNQTELHEKESKKKIGIPQWKTFKTTSEGTLFDGEILSEYWVLMFGIDGTIAAFDLRTKIIHEGQICANVSLFSVVYDGTGRNLLLSGDQGVIVRVSLLDNGEASPPSLTCQTYSMKTRGLNGMAVRGHQLLMTSDTGIHLENPQTLMPQFSIPVDIQWQ